MLWLSCQCQNNVQQFVLVLLGHTLVHSTPHIVSGADAILCGLRAQVHHLVEAELTAIN